MVAINTSAAETVRTELSASELSSSRFHRFARTTHRNREHNEC
jgi:hypothetical protein